MKKIVLILFCLLLIPQDSFAAYKQANHIQMAPNLDISTTRGAASGMLINADGERIAFKFYATTTSAITDIDFRANETGDITGITFRVQIQGDSSDAPDGSNLGGTATFAGPAADGFVGLQTLSSNTGALTVGTPYWVVIDETTGTPDGSNSLGVFESGLLIGTSKIRHYDTTNWTNTSARNEFGIFVVKHADSTYGGFVTQASADSSATDIYDTNRQGIKMTFGCQVKIIGIRVAMAVKGSPGNVTVKVYEGSTEKYSSNALPASEFRDNQYMTILLNSPTLLSADTAVYVTIEQDGASDANDYDVRVRTFDDSTYSEVSTPANYDFIYGSGADPTGYSVSTTEFSEMGIIITDLATEFDQAAATGAVANGAMSVGF